MLFIVLIQRFKNVKILFENRWWWIFAVSSSLCMSSFMIRKIWIQWDENPITTVIGDEIELEADYIPFPTITICPESKIQGNKFDFSSALKNLSNFKTK